MKKGCLGSLAALLAGAGLALAQAPPMPTPAVQGTQPGITPPPTTENAAPSSAPEVPPVDQQPWNPSIKQGSEWPYPELPRGWFSGLCPDLGDFWLSADYLLWAIKGGRLPPL